MGKEHDPLLSAVAKAEVEGQLEEFASEFKGQLRTAKWATGGTLVIMILGNFSLLSWLENSIRREAVYEAKKAAQDKSNIDLLNADVYEAQGKLSRFLVKLEGQERSLKDTGDTLESVTDELGVLDADASTIQDKMKDIGSQVNELAIKLKSDTKEFERLIVTTRDQIQSRSQEGQQKLIELNDEVNLNNLRGLVEWTKSLEGQERIIQLEKEHGILQEKAGGLRQPPIGSILAWHKSWEGSPAIPEGWMECNGVRVDDPESPYYGKQLPNLNSAYDYERGRFLRGGVESGVNHEASGVAVPLNLLLWFMYNNLDKYGTNKSKHFNIKMQDTISRKDKLFIDYDDPYVLKKTVRLGSATPVNMSVVWIIRVK